MKKKLVFWLIFFCFLVFLFYFYINYIFFPVKLKHIIEEKATAIFGRPVSIEEIHFKPIQGFTLRDISVWEQETKEQLFIKIDEANFNILLAPLFKEKAVIIPSLKLSHPSIYVAKENVAQWNFSDLLAQTANTQQQKNPFKLYLFKLVIKDGKIDYRDKTTTPEFFESLEMINTEINLSLNKNIKFKGYSQIPAKGSSLSFEGNYDLVQKKISSQISLQKIHLAQYISRLFPSFNFSVQDGVLASANLHLEYDFTDFRIKGDCLIENAFLLLPNQKTVRGDIQANNFLFNLDGAKQGTLEGDLEIKKALLSLGSDQELSAEVKAPSFKLNWTGEKFFTLQSQIEIKNGYFLQGEHLKIQSDITASIDTATLTPEEFLLQGHLTINNAHAQFDQDASARGNISAENIALTIKDNTLKILGDIVVDHFNLNLDKEKSVHVNTFTCPLVLTTQEGKLDIQSQFEIKEGAVSINPRIKFQGDSTGEINISYSPQIPSSLQYNGSVNLAAAILKYTTLETPNLEQSLTNISGRVSYAANLVRWENIQATFKDEIYTLNGELNNFSRPVLKTALLSSKIKLETQINILNNAFQIIHLNGNYLNNSFDVKGDVHLFKDKDPDCDLRASLSLDLKEVPGIIKEWASDEFLTQWQDKLDSTKPEGTLVLEGLWRGRIKDWRDWELTFKAQSPRISFMNFSLKDLNVDFGQREQYIHQCHIAASIYEGIFDLTLSAQLRDELLPVQANFILANLDLAKLKEDRKLETKNLAGKLSGNLVINGPLCDLNQLTGQGSLAIHEGNLYQWKILEGILSLVMIEEFKDVVFTDGQASFMIRNKKILTEDAEVISQPITLHGKGWLDFDQNLHFNVTPQFSEIAILKSPSLKKGTTSLLGGIIAIEVMGTIDNPKSRPILSPMKAIKNTTEYLMEGLKGIFDEVF